MSVVDFTISRREPYADGRQFAEHGAYEQIDGVLTFAVDPDADANRAIVDLSLAPRDGDGRVSFEADFSLVQPVEPKRGDGRVIVELPNRGRRRVVPTLNMAPPGTPVTRQAHPGDGFLFRHGFSVASIGWQWDVYRSDSLMGLDAPLAMVDGEPVGGETVVDIRPSECCRTWLLADRVHRPLPAADAHDTRAVLYVRDYEDGEDTEIARDQWQFARLDDAGQSHSSPEHVMLATGFVPGKIYHLVYRTNRAPIAGCGLLALRDVAPYLRGRAANGAASEFGTVLAYGVSQTGRMLRHFVGLGLNCTEAGELAYDGILAHVAGARRGAFNHRFAQPSNQTTPVWGHLFPFADLPTTDALTGVTGGLLDRMTGPAAATRIIYTNSAAEYWRGDGALVHIDTGAGEDLPEARNSRSYLFASAQHGAGYLGQSRFQDGVGTTARYPLNVLDYRPLLRAAMLNLDRWVHAASPPPPSRHPRLGDGTAVPRERVLEQLGRIPGLEVPDPRRLPFVRTVDLGSDEATGVGRYPAREGEYYPALVSAVDDDGNELAGIRLPDVAVPVATLTGWNPRDPATGSAEQVVPMHGMTLFLTATAGQREAAGDPRPSLAERYRDREDYAARVLEHAQALVDGRYLLAEDLECVVANALTRYDAALAQADAGICEPDGWAAG